MGVLLTCGVDEGFKGEGAEGGCYAARGEFINGGYNQFMQRVGGCAMVVVRGGFMC